MSELVDRVADQSHALGYIRVIPLRRLSPSEKVIGAMLARGVPTGDIQKLLNLNETSLRGKIQDLAAKIPGDLPAIAKIVVYFRGASYGVLTGRHLPVLPELGAALADIGKAPPVGNTAPTV